jgi:hypothetical protein
VLADLEQSIQESWRRVWRVGVAPLLPLDGLVALERALETDDPRLLQAATCSPPPLACVQDFPVEACCLVAFAGWHGNNLHTVSDVENYFADVCHEADQQLGEAGAIRWLLIWFDETPRVEMRRLLLPEVKREIARRTDESANDDR